MALYQTMLTTSPWP